MNNFVFKIFGAPHTFDLYQGDEGEIGYFQNFDNGGKENVKLTIHRTAGGKVSYSYLRYNFISSSGRPNSFFGMSVLFDKEYCNDVENLFELFDAVYNDVILKNGILLTELKDNKAAQAKYLVQTFAEADGEVKNVENNIINNLKNHFKGDILPIDSSFLDSNSMVKLNNEMDNARYVNALRKYSWVHISPEYNKNEQPIPSDEFLSKLKDKTEKVRDRIPIISVKAVNGGNIEKEVNDYLYITNNLIEDIYVWLESVYKLQKGANFNSYLQKQPKLKERYDKLLEIQKPLKELSDAARKKTTSTPRKGLSNANVARKKTTPIPPILPSREDTNPESSNPNTELLFSSIDSNWQKYKSKIIGGAVVVVAVLIVYIFIPMPPVDTPKIAKTNSTTTTEKSVDELVELGNQALDNKDFDIAIANFGKAGKNDLIFLAKSKAIQYWNEQAVNAETPQESINFLKKTIKYGNDPTVDIADFQKKIDQQTVSSIAAAERKRQEKARRQSQKTLEPTPQQPITPTCENVTIIKSDSKKLYSKGDKFQAIAKSGTTTCTGGEWRYEGGLYADKTKNPTIIEIVSVPPDGKGILRYYVGGEQKAGIEIKIAQ